ncbi:MAG: hypothetical protein WCD76_00725 [Pyrinomonadaceae bacterium]
MKRAKRILFVLLAGFLAFAPPGTMIFGLALVVGLVRHFTAASRPAAPVAQTQTTPTPTPPLTPTPSPTPSVQSSRGN